jgi:hypothetical protein
MSLSAEIGTAVPTDALPGETIAAPGTTANATTVLLSRGAQTYYWGRGDHVVFVGDVSGLRTSATCPGSGPCGSSSRRRPRAAAW